MNVAHNYIIVNTDGLVISRRTTPSDIEVRQVKGCVNAHTNKQTNCMHTLIDGHILS